MFQNYLINYGYLEEKTIDGKRHNHTSPPSALVHDHHLNGTVIKKLYTQKEIQAALYDFQSFFRLPTSGKIDNATLTVVRKPRCGNRDRIPRTYQNSLRLKVSQNGRRKLRSAVLGNTLRDKKQTLIVFHLDVQHKSVLNPKYNPQDQKTIRMFQYAFNFWAAVTNVIFVSTEYVRMKEYGAADVTIGFYKGGEILC